MRCYQLRDASSTERVMTAAATAPFSKSPV